MVSRGEVWLVSLDPTLGREIKKTRPALIVSPNEMNEVLRTVVVAPMSTAASTAPFRVPITFQGTKGLVLMDQLRAIDRQRLVRLAGRVSGKMLLSSLRVLQEMFAE